ncbi:MAG: hypothetical protein GIW95_05750 [Candidatus Eremiobacteraeota bacterium]|nr:hypothetical protein [Candidatus Eremiobacteraeota bacterium]
MALALGLFFVLSASTAARAGQPQAGHPIAPAASGHHTAVAGARLQFGIQSGRQQPAAPPQQFKPLQIPVTPHKIEPSPVPSPEFNPLKRRRMAMPGVPEVDLAF